MGNIQRKKLYLIDGTALAYRSHFAFIRNPLVNSKGMNTGAVYGFAITLIKILKEAKPDFIGIVFDSKEPTFRHKKYKEYKATREKMPDEMIDQLPYIEKLVKAMSLPFIVKPTFEADDIIGTLASRYGSKDIMVCMVSGDKDLAQLINENVEMLTPKKGSEMEVLDVRGVEKKFGVSPSRIIDLLSLMGDSSDNVPGIPGVGEKTALKLLKEFDSLENVLKNPDRIGQKKLAQSIRDNGDLALLSRELTTIDKDVPIDLKLEDLKQGKPDERSLTELYSELEFHSLLEKIEITPKEEENTEYLTIESVGGIEKLLKELKNASFFVFDTETTQINPILAELVGISFCLEEKKAYYVPFNLKKEGMNFSPGNLIERLRPIFEDTDILKGGHNVKYDYLVMKKAGIEVRGIKADTMIGSYLLDPSQRQHNLDIVSLQRLGYKKIPLESLIGKGSASVSMKDVDIAKVAQYSCEDSDITMRLHGLFKHEIKKLGLDKLYAEVEMPLSMVLAAMEWEGVKVDAKLLGSLSKKIDKDLENLESEITAMAGEQFNINSPKQLGSVLFEKLKIHNELGIKRVRKTKTGYSTDSQNLEVFSEHPIISKILEYRNLSKLKSTYLDALPELINPDTGRIHTSFNQTVTATGRLSSSDPNLQNIPIRAEIGREIRKAFIPRDRDWSILSADYSQIELRILAHLSRDENLIKTFKDGVDVHRRTAATIFGIQDKDVTSDLRNRAKAINFGIIYGMGPQRLARETKIPFEEAQRFIESYFEKYPSIKRFITDQIKFAKENGFVKTLLGRLRYIPDIMSDNPRLKINAEHIAVNTPIQGSAADMIKIAMINIDKRLKEERLYSKMILQVHDELVFECPDNELETVSKIVKEDMENAIDLDVPIKAELKHGKSWFEAH